MTKIISAENIDLGKVEEFQTKTGSGKINNIGTESVMLSDIVSNSGLFEVGFVAKKVFPPFPVSSTIYFRENFVLQNANGEFVTTDQGYGIAGTTDENGKFTPSCSLPSISITSPLEGAEIEPDSTFTLTWKSSNVTLLNLVIKSATGIKTVSDIDATLGTLEVTLTADTGTFQALQEISITLECTIGECADTINIEGLGVITNLATDPVSPTEATDFDISCDTNINDGEDIDFEYSANGVDNWLPLGSGEISGGSASDTVQIPTTGTWYLRGVYGAEVVVSASLERTVQSAIKFGIQFGGTNNDYLRTGIKIGTDYYLSGYTQSAQLFGVNTGYASGYMPFLCKLNSAGEKQWIIFGTNSTGLAIQTLCYDSASERFFWISQSSDTSAVSRIKLDGSGDGSEQIVWGGGSAMIYGVTCDTSNVFYCGYDGTNPLIRKNVHALNSGSTQTIKKTGAGSVTAISIAIDSTRLYISCNDSSNTQGYIAKIDKSGFSTISYSDFFGEMSYASTGATTRLLVPTHDGTNRQVKMIQLSDLSILYTQNIDTKYTDTLIRCSYSSTLGKFICAYKNADNTQIKINYINDADTFTGNETSLALNSGVFSSHAVVIDKLLCGTIDGKLLADSTDAGGTDCFIQEIE